MLYNLSVNFLDFVWLEFQVVRAEIAHNFLIFDAIIHVIAFLAQWA